jgi:hypothetical protein
MTIFDCLMRAINSVFLVVSLLLLPSSAFAQSTNSGLAPQIIANSAPQSTYRNLLIGGDFGQNLWQRGGQANGGLSGKYCADRWFEYSGATANDACSKVTNSTALQGFSAFLNLARTNGSAITTSPCIAQIIETSTSITAQGQQITFSFFATKNTGYTSPTGRVLVSVVGGTGTDQNSGNFIAGTWTGQTNIVQQWVTLSSTPYGGGVARYSLTGTVPANITEIGVSVCLEVSGTAVTADGVLMSGMQLEVAANATPFERHTTQEEALLEYRYYYLVAEPAANTVVASGMVSTGTAAVFSIPSAFPMRVTPTCTAVAGSFQIESATFGQLPVTSINGFFGSSIGCSLTANVASGVVQGNPSLLLGGGGSGSIAMSAEM